MDVIHFLSEKKRKTYCQLNHRQTQTKTRFYPNHKKRRRPIERPGLLLQNYSNFPPLKKINTKILVPSFLPVSYCQNIVVGSPSTSTESKGVGCCPLQRKTISFVPSLYANKFEPMRGPGLAVVLNSFLQVRTCLKKVVNHKINCNFQYNKSYRSVPAIQCFSIPVQPCPLA
jgi:hypothetical protein